MMEIITSIKDFCMIETRSIAWPVICSIFIFVNDDFSYEKKQQADERNVKVQQWVEIMRKYVQPCRYLQKRDVDDNE